MLTWLVFLFVSITQICLFCLDICNFLSLINLFKWFTKRFTQPDHCEQLKARGMRSLVTFAARASENVIARADRRAARKVGNMGNTCFHSVKSVFVIIWNLCLYTCRYDISPCRRTLGQAYATSYCMTSMA